MGNTFRNYIRYDENYEIHFVLIFFLIAKFFFLILLDIEWIGSGAQGAVFSGKINNKIVAIKKVKELHETNIKHLSKLDHDNIVKFL